MCVDARDKSSKLKFLVASLLRSQFKALSIVSATSNGSLSMASGTMLLIILTVATVFSSSMSRSSKLDWLLRSQPSASPISLARCSSGVSALLPKKFESFAAAPPTGAGPLTSPVSCPRSQSNVFVSLLASAAAMRSMFPSFTCVSSQTKAAFNLRSALSASLAEKCPFRTANVLPRLSHHFMSGGKVSYLPKSCSTSDGNGGFEGLFRSHQRQFSSTFSIFFFGSLGSWSPHALLYSSVSNQPIMSSIVPKTSTSRSKASSLFRVQARTSPSPKGFATACSTVAASSIKASTRSLLGDESWSGSQRKLEFLHHFKLPSISF